MPDQPETRTEWQQFYDQHAPRYHENPFTRHTNAEVDFMLSFVGLPAGAKILDVGCGIGRHALEFTRRGLSVTALDISERMLEEGRKAATAEDLDVDWVQGDATEYVAPELHDMAVCLCEGAFNLIGSQEEPITHDLSVLRNIAASLKPNALFFLNALNGYAFIRQVNDQAIEVLSFDPLTMIATYQDTWSLPEGMTVMNIRERLYIPPEVSAMLYVAGFEVMALYGGTAGEWGRRPLKLDEVEMMFVCRKK